VHWRMPLVYVTASQAAQLLQIFPEADGATRIALLIALWDLLVDEENMNLLWKLFSREGKLEIMQRMGHLVLFNPMSPDGVYRLDFGIREDSIIAQILVQLARKEPGENVLDEAYNGSSQCTPSSWETSPPASGIWELRYVTPPGCALIDLRKSLATHLLGWEGVDEVKEEVVIDPHVDHTAKLTEGELGLLRRLFNEFDKDKSGNIEKDELRGAIEALDAERTPSCSSAARSEIDIEKIMKAMDADDGGSVSFDEFASTLSHRLIKARDNDDKAGKSDTVTDFISEITAFRRPRASVQAARGAH